MPRTRIHDTIELLHFGFQGAIRESVRRVRGHGLTRMDHTLLYLAEQMPGLTVSEFVRRYGASKQALTKPLRELVERGLLEQRADAVDGRVKHLHLTPAGAAVVADLNDGFTETFDRAFRRAGREARQGWVAVMKELAASSLDPQSAKGASVPAAAIGRIRPDSPTTEQPVRERMQSGVELRVSTDDVAAQARAAKRR